MKNVDTQHKLYPSLSTKRAAFRAVKGGTATLRDGGAKYLPKYPAETPEDHKARLGQATCDGLVGSGCDTLAGSVFYGEIDTSKVNPAIQAFLENIDNKGTHFNVFVRQAFDAAFDGSAVILVDMPKLTEVHAEQMKVYGAEADRTLNRRPYWSLYYADDVINWRDKTDELTKKTQRVLLTLHEPKEEDDPNNPFATKTVDYYRVYRLENGVVSWTLYVKTDKADDPFIEVDGGILDKRSAIPAAVIGCLEDEPRLMVESDLEIKAYQKESSFDTIEYLSIPILTAIGREGDAIGSPMAYGPSQVLDVPVGGDAKYLTIDAAGHDSLKGTIQGIKDTIKARVNELVTTAVAEKTATQSSIEDRDKQARLIVWAEQFKDAIELALGYTAEAMGLGIDQGGEIVLMTKWEHARIQAEEQKAREAASQEAAIELTKARASV